MIYVVKAFSKLILLPYRLNDSVGQANLANKDLAIAV
jgi:hypothetical protein